MFHMYKKKHTMVFVGFQFKNNQQEFFWKINYKKVNIFNSQIKITINISKFYKYLNFETILRNFVRLNKNAYFFCIGNKNILILIFF